MNFIKNLLDFLELIQRNGLENCEFLSLPFHFYCKDHKGKYIESNDCQARDAGFNNRADMLGSTDFDARWAKDAFIATKNDQEVILTGKPKIIIEHCTVISNGINALSYKTPLCTSTGKIIGIRGISLWLDTEHSYATYYKLSKREHECLYFLVRGKSDKEIAKILNLSPRTVESHINSIKTKMCCSNRSQVIEKSFDEELLNMLRCKSLLTIPTST